jgi:glycosyltransferase involved in cell wall biosynthesis
MEKKLNIIRLCPVYYPYIKHGGSVVADYELDKSLCAEGHSVTVLSCKENKNKNKKKINLNKVKIFYFSCIGSILHGISIGALFELIKLAICKRKNIDIVWFGGAWNLFTIIGPIICRIFSLKYIITPHGMLIPKLIKKKSKFLKLFAVKFFLKKNLSKAFKVHFTAKKEFKDTSRVVKAEIKPIIFPLTFDLKKFNSNLPIKNKKIVLSFIGNIQKKKRIDLVFEALKLLPVNIKKKLKFNIIGTDKDDILKNYKYLEKNFGVETHFFGPLFKNKLVKAYHLTDIFILCSESENFGISVIEAAYSKCALIISKHVGVSEYFSDGDAIISSLNVKDIKKKIIFLVNRPEILKSYKIAARKVSEQFNSSALSKNYFYDLLV